MPTRAPGIGFYCDDCDRYSTWTPPFSEEKARCAHCDHPNPPTEAARRLSGEAPPTLGDCLQCGNPELYRKKDVPQQIGCAVVLSAVALSTAAYALWDFPGAFAVFAAVALLDFLIYRRLGEVTVCYRCHAEFRRFPVDPRHGAFDMHRAEEYEAD